MTEPLTVAAQPVTECTAIDTSDGLTVATSSPAGRGGSDSVTELAILREQLASAHAELDSARRLRDIREAEFIEFKDSVARVAMRYARRHGWCSVVSDALADLGLQSPDLSVSGTFTVTYSFTGTIANSDYERLTADWIGQSLDISADSGPAFDSDWDDVEITVERVDVDSYRSDDDEG